MGWRCRGLPRGPRSRGAARLAGLPGSGDRGLHAAFPRWGGARTLPGRPHGLDPERPRHTKLSAFSDVPPTKAPSISLSAII